MFDPEVIAGNILGMIGGATIWWFRRRSRLRSESLWSTTMGGTAGGNPDWMTLHMQMMGQQLGQIGQAQFHPDFVQQWLRGGSGFIEPPDLTAEKTAEELLLRHLTDEQRASWEKYRGFWTTSSSNTRYWLDGLRPRSMSPDGPPQSHCIDVLDEGGRLLPVCDRILAQKLLIETDEEKFLKTANAARI